MITFQTLKRNTISLTLLAMLTSPAIALCGETSRPLKASVVTHEQPGFKPDCPSKFGGTTTGTGKSNHLGKVSLKASDCITPMENHFIFKGEFTLTAANGDNLSGGYSGSFVPVGAGPMYSLSDAKFEITGGTGRFRTAKGIADLKGNQDIMTGKGKIDIDGTISY